MKKRYILLLNIFSTILGITVQSFYSNSVNYYNYETIEKYKKNEKVWIKNTKILEEDRKYFIDLINETLIKTILTKDWYKDLEQKKKLDVLLNLVDDPEELLLTYAYYKTIETPEIKELLNDSRKR